jgi:hypothetical protein
MAYQQILSYVSFGLEYLNNKLIVPTNLVQNGLSLKTETLPQILKTPVNFASVILFAAYIVFSFANNLICNIIGILYPLMYGLTVFSEDPINTNMSITLNKYWMLFCGFMLIDSFFGFILHWIPGYFYFKVGVIYALIRNDFALTNTAFAMLEKLYVESNLRPNIEKIINLVSSKMRTNTNNSKTE